MAGREQRARDRVSALLHVDALGGGGLGRRLGLSFFFGADLEGLAGFSGTGAAAISFRRPESKV